jgi:carboxylesterase
MKNRTLVLNMQQVFYLSGFDPVPLEYEGRLYKDANPFYLQHEPRSRAIAICIHGFTAMPYNVSPASYACFAQGMDSVAPLLPRHGFAQLTDQRREFPQMTQAELLQAVRQEIERARQQYEWVGLLGDSMGGAIALILASEGLVDACAVTAPALKLPWRAGLVFLVPPGLNVNIPKPNRPNFYHPCYPFESSRAGRTLQQIAATARECLPKITCPVFVAHSHGDRTIDPIVADWVQQYVQGPVEVAWFDESDHALLLDVRGKDVAEAIATFFAQQVNVPISQQS